MADISKITLPSGNTYDLKDQGARDLIAQLQGASYFLGITTTALTDQATTNPITIDGDSVTAVNGNIVVYGNKEFIFNGAKWLEFGDLSSLGALAYKSSVSLGKGSGSNVLGEDTTFTASAPTVTVTPAADKLVTTTVPNVTGSTDVTIPNVTGNTSVTANKSTWSFTMGSGNDAETLIIGGGNGSDVSASKVTLGNVLSASKVTLGTPITAATGAVSSSGSGDSVVTGITSASAAAPTITVGTNDKVKVAEYDDLSVTVS